MTFPSTMRVLCEAYYKARKSRGVSWGYWTALAVILTMFLLPTSARLTPYAAMPQVLRDSLCW